MEMSWLTDPWDQGPGRVWMRLRHPILPGEPTTPLVRLVATADFGNGVSAELPFDKYLFINADLTIHLWRAPQGEWIGLDAHTLLHERRHGHRRERAARRERPGWTRVSDAGRAAALRREVSPRRPGNGSSSRASA